MIIQFYVWILLITFGYCMNIPFKVEIDEERPIGTKIANIQSFVDKNFYDITNYEASMVNKYFSIKSKGDIIVKKQIDLDSFCTESSLCCNAGPCVIKSKVYINSGLYTFPIEITIIDINDNKPIFDTPIQVVKIHENSRIRSTISIESGKDFDISDNNQIKTYRFVEKTNTFQLSTSDMSGLLLVTQRDLDYEKQQKYDGILTACDSGPLCTNRTIEIHIIDINDNYPNFTKSLYMKKINEDFPINRIILQVTAIDKDDYPNNITEYQFVSTSSNYRIIQQTFALNSRTGEIKLLRKLTAKAMQKYDFRISAKDEKDYSSQHIQQTSVIIHVEDINDHAPDIQVFEKSNLYELGNKVIVDINENEPAKKLFALRVTDDDLGINSQVECLLTGSRQELILKNRDTNVYEIRTLKQFNYEKEDKFEAEFNCQDRGIPPQRSKLSIIINIQDVNEYPPKFLKSQYNIDLKENTPQGIKILQVQANDEDKSSQIKYKIKDYSKRQYYEINEETGDIITGQYSFDRESINNDQFTVIATDSLKPPIKSSEVNVYVNIIDVNDNIPQFQPNSLLFNIRENSYPNTKLKGKLLANDNDIDKANHFTLFELKGILNSSGILIKEHLFSVKAHGDIYVLDNIDREKNPNYTLLVVVKDQGNPILTSNARVTILVDDENDNAPIWKYPKSSSLPNVNISDSIEAGTLIVRLQAYDPDADAAGRVHYYLDNKSEKLFRVNSSTGELITRRSPLPRGVYRLELTAQDGGFPSKSTKVFMQINVTDTSGPLSGLNLAIIVIMIVVTLIIALFLIIGIVCVKRKPSMMVTHGQNYPQSSMGTLKEGGNCNQDNLMYNAPFIGGSGGGGYDDTNHLQTGFMTSADVGGGSSFLFIPPNNYYLSSASSNMDLSSQQRYPLVGSGSGDMMAPMKNTVMMTVAGPPNSQNYDDNMSNCGGASSHPNTIEPIIVGNSGPIIRQLNSSSTNLNQSLIYTPLQTTNNSRQNNTNMPPPPFEYMGDGESADSGRGASEVDMRLQNNPNFMGRNFMSNSSTLPHGSHLHKQLSPHSQTSYPYMIDPHYHTMNNTNKHHPDLLLSPPASSSTTIQTSSRFLTPTSTQLQQQHNHPSHNPCYCFNILPEHDDNDDHQYMVPMTTFSTSYNNNNNTTTTTLSPQSQHSNKINNNNDWTTQNKILEHDILND